MAEWSVTMAIGIANDDSASVLIRRISILQLYPLIITCRLILKKD
jgi:hypothetical protein